MIEIRHRTTGAVLHAFEAGALAGQVLGPVDLRRADVRGWTSGASS
jgi:hypothetical protein